MCVHMGATKLAKLGLFVADHVTNITDSTEQGRSSPISVHSAEHIRHSRVAPQSQAASECQTRSLLSQYFGSPKGNWESVCHAMQCNVEKHR